MTASSRVKHFYSHAKFGGFDYDNNADCDWAIEAEEGRNVQLTFLTFDVRIRHSLDISLEFDAFPDLISRLKTRKHVRMTLWRYLVDWTTTVVPYTDDIVVAP